VHSCLAVLAFLAAAVPPRPLLAQPAHAHTTPLGGLPEGIPVFCADPTIRSVASGAWSSPATWSARRVPGIDDKVLIGAGHDVAYDATSEATLSCIEVRGRLAFSTDANSRMSVGTVTVMEGGTLEVGTPARPVAPDVTAEIVLADRRFDPAVDPAHLGNAIIGLGTVTMHGAVKAPTFVRLAREPLAGEARLVFDQTVSGWQIGDRLVLPDTRQISSGQRQAGYHAQDEEVQIAAISGIEVTLRVPLAFDHKGARNAEGRVDFLPHVGNVSRNVVVRSENAAGTRGHAIFISHASVDLRYAEFRDMGRTKPGALDSTEFDALGRAVRVGTNQIGRYAIHFHHDFGPRKTPPNGYQFTFIGNAVDSAPKWGVVVHNSHYGLIEDNVVYRTHGAGIVTEDGTESFNVFEHNFALRSDGSGEFAPRSGYGGPAPDPGGEGAGFWFRGPNNYIRNNVSANGDAFGYGLAAGSLGVVRIPKFKGADPSLDAESAALDTTGAPVLEFANNEAYGTVQTGLACGWNGMIRNFTVWHASRQGITGLPADDLIVDGVTVRGDTSLLGDRAENTAGVWFANYRARSVIVRNADVQGMRIGVASPFFSNNDVDTGRGDGSFIVERGYFRTNIGVVVGTAYTAERRNDKPIKSAVVRDIVFEPVTAATLFPAEAISMNHGMAPDDRQTREPILVFNFNRTPGDDFKIYYSLEAPPEVAPCHDTKPGIGGWVCR
jgi:G8 domain